MSRGVRDLRDMICVSRLTVRDSDEEYPLSEDDDGRVSRFFDDLSLTSGSRQSSACSNSEPGVSPDSGIGTNSQVSSQVTPDTDEPIPPTAAQPVKKRNRKKRKQATKSVETLPTKHELPSKLVLPPVLLAPDLPDVPDTAEVQNDCNISTKNDKKPSDLSGAPKHGTVDEFLTYLDTSMVAEWLERANTQVTELSTWCNAGENFVDFAQFWLTEFPDIQRYDIFKLEHSIIVDHLEVAFSAGRNSGIVRHQDIILFVEAVFREYPARLLSSKGPHLFLDYLDVLTSERQTTYKRLLSDVKCSTRVKEFAQLVLAIRSFALVSVWSAVVDFYRRLFDGGESRGEGVPQIGTGLSKLHHVRMYQAIRKGYVALVHYLLSTGKVRANDQDAQGRSLIFNSVMHNQKSVLTYLLMHVRPPPDVNRAAKTGNSPLHAAANSGNVELVQLLVKSADINAQNPMCDGATPLHLAAMHGHNRVVEVLLRAKADVTMKMGGLTAADLARDFGHDNIVSLLKSD